MGDHGETRVGSERYELPHSNHSLSIDSPSTAIFRLKKEPSVTNDGVQSLTEKTVQE